MNQSCKPHIMLQSAAGDNKAWLVFWIFIALLSIIINIVALFVVRFGAKRSSSYNYCIKSLFMSHLVSAIIVLPMLSTLNITKIPSCVHVPLMTYIAAMTHFASTVSVLGVSINLFLRVRSNVTFETPKTKRKWLKIVSLSWFISFIAGFLPLFLPVYVFMMPALVIIMSANTYGQIRTLATIKSRPVGSSSIRQLHRRYETTLLKTIMYFMCINLTFTVLPYSAFILSKTKYFDSENVKRFLSIASKLPFTKGMAESLVYCLTQRTFRRRVATSLNRIFVQSV